MSNLETTQKQWTILNWTLSAIIGLAVGASYAIRALKTPLLSPSAYVAAGLGIGLAYLVLTRLIQPTWWKWPARIRWGMLGVSSLLAGMIVFNLHRSPAIYWQFDTDPNTWRPAWPFARTTWGESMSVLVLHPTDRPDGADSPAGPWRATADLSGVFDGVAKQLSFQLTQPEGGIIPQQTKQIAAPGSGDGVTVVFKIERAGVWQTVKQVHLDLINYSEQRHWHTVQVEVPADSRRVRIEALPGPPGSNIYFDLVWVSLAQVTPAGRQPLAPLFSLADLIALSFLGFSGLVLVSRLIETLNRSGFFNPEEITRGAGTDERLKKRALLLGYLAPVLAISPSLVWTALDRSPFGGDQSQYGIATVQLFYTLIHSPASWGSLMLGIFPVKPNGLIWIGQFFVPLGYLIGSINRGLLFSIWVMQALVLILIYRSIWELSKGKLLVAIVGCLVIASASLFIGFARNYSVESIQTLAVAWFVLIMSFAPRWSRAFILSQLLAATAFAMLTKQTTPLFCLWPGLMALGYAFWPRQTQSPGGWLQKQTLVTLALGVPLSLATTAWYYRNMEYVIWHLYAGSTGPVVTAMWGKEDTFLNTMIFWLGVVQRSFFLPSVLVLGLGVFVSGVIYYFMKPDRPMKHFLMCCAISVLQIMTVLSAFSLSSTRVHRYLLPLLPYFAILICWSVAQINRPILTSLAIVIFTAQLATIYGQALGMTGPNPNISPYLRAVDRDGRQARVLNSIISRTCTETSTECYLNILAIDANLQGDWLAPEPANYVAVRNLAPHDDLPPCYYGYLGGNFFGSSATNAWNDMLFRGVRYFITIDPEVYPVPPKVYNQALSQHNFPIIWEKVQTSDLFKLEPPLPEDPGILIFRRIDYVALGRTLSDQGEHEQAIDTLRKATALEPANVEAWANLCLAYVR
jgi:hypothetical protein